MNHVLLLICPIFILMLVGCSPQPHPSDEAFKTMTESCKQHGQVVHYHNTGTSVTLTCSKAD